jgi:hypothetical protein
MNTRFPNRYLPYVLIAPMIVVIIVFLSCPAYKAFTELLPHQPPGKPEDFCRPG